MLLISGKVWRKVLNVLIPITSTYSRFTGLIGMFHYLGNICMIIQSGGKVYRLLSN
ncbi:hypothetical protein SASPL_116583 [Salvia splendens]|uniref:Uncharacterized protein n=1 Tax=Salvia splendens TaxID=180675 RepID=A0A8X8XU16_SALSN|nr:hypothetical protein SASPL_116583 [Salvia splendens]